MNCNDHKNTYAKYYLPDNLWHLENIKVHRPTQVQHARTAVPRSTSPTLIYAPKPHQMHILYVQEYNFSTY